MDEEDSEIAHASIVITLRSVRNAWKLAIRQGPTGQTSSHYGPRRAAYDLKKLRAKDMVLRIGKSHRYEATPYSLKAMAALLVLRNQVIRPLLASSINRTPSRGAQNPTGLDQCYASLRTHMQDLLQQLGVTA